MRCFSKLSCLAGGGAAATCTGGATPLRPIRRVIDRAPTAQPAKNTPMSLARICLLLQDSRYAGLHHLRQFGGIPIRQPDASVGLRVSDVRRLRRSMNAVVLLRERYPHDAYGIIGARLDFDFGLLALGVPEQVRVVMKYRVPSQAQNFPFSNRKRIVLTAHAGGKMRQHFAGFVESAHA